MVEMREKRRLSPLIGSRVPPHEVRVLLFQRRPCLTCRAPSSTLAERISSLAIIWTLAVFEFALSQGPADLIAARA